MEVGDHTLQFVQGVESMNSRSRRSSSEELEFTYIVEREFTDSDTSPRGAAAILSSNGLQQVVRAVRAALVDVKAALDEMPREELEELTAVALAVSRMAMSTLQRASRQVAEGLERHGHIPQGRILIEDLDGEAAPQHWTPADGIRIN